MGGVVGLAEAGDLEETLGEVNHYFIVHAYTALYIGLLGR